MDRYLACWVICSMLALSWIVPAAVADRRDPELENYPLWSEAAWALAIAATGPIALAAIAVAYVRGYRR